jgi:cytochrome c oxidase subunit II
VPLVEAPTNVLWWSLLNWYLFLGFAAGAIVTVWMLYYILKYRERKNVKDAPHYHHEDESGWGNWKTVVLTLLVTGGVLAFVEYQTFASTGLITPPNTTGDPIYINVTAQQFAWSFGYSDGYTAVGNLTVPVNSIVILNITSIDVDHSFSIESLSVAKDAIPGEHNFVWFNATQTGFIQNDIRCKELCGVGHANMIADFNVTTAAGFQAFLTAHAVSTASTSSTTITGPVSIVTLPQGAGGVQKLNFSPASLTVASGTTIEFNDVDNSAIHNIYFTSVPTGASMPSPNPSPNLKQGTTFYVTLTTPGTYKYECQYHSGWMQGTIIVS